MKVSFQLKYLTYYFSNHSLFSIYLKSPTFQELIWAFIAYERRTAKKEKRAATPCTVKFFHEWATSKLQSPRSVWLYNTAFSFGLPLLVLRAAIRWVTLKPLIICAFLNDLDSGNFYFKTHANYRLNNVEVAKGALYCAKSLAWASYLPLYRQAILRSGLVEESQVGFLA